MMELTDKAKEARRAYKRAWNHANRDKVKAAQARYWNKKAEQMEAEKAEPVPEASGTA